MIQTGLRRRRRYVGAVQSVGMSRLPMRFQRSTDASVAERGTLPLTHGRPLTAVVNDATASFPAALTNAPSSATLGPAPPAPRQCSRLAIVVSRLQSPDDAQQQPGLVGRSVEADLAVEHTSALPLATLETVHHASAPPSRAANVKRRKSQGRALLHSSSVATPVELCSPVDSTTATTSATHLALAHPVPCRLTDTVPVASLWCSFLAQRQHRRVATLVARLLVVAATLALSAATEDPAPRVYR